MFCKNCGKELEKGSEFCSKCGTQVNGLKEQDINYQSYPPQYYQQYNQYNAVKVPGNGLSIAGMVLGIIALAYALITLMAVCDYDYLAISIYAARNVSAYALGVVLIQSILALTGLPLSISGMLKRKSAKNITGIILNTITIIMSIIMFIYIIVTFG